jgi:hypothetical protein
VVAAVAKKEESPKSNNFSSDNESDDAEKLKEERSRMLALIKNNKKVDRSETEILNNLGGGILKDLEDDLGLNQETKQYSAQK